VTRHIFDRLLERAGDLKGRRVLDLGCGSGWASAIYAQRGALVTGIELSSEALRAARKYIAGKCLDDKVGFYAMPAECLGFPSGIFDCVLGSSVLHHTDLSRSIPEVARVLKPGGSAIFIEPLIHNPVLKLYRWLTPQYRSPSERPLSIEEIRGMDLYFSSVTREDFYLVSLVSFFWSKVIRSDRLLLSWLDALVRVDKWILLWFPWLGRYCWGTLVVLRK
jgi:SAM-dependent methyltransferase